jgi:hypothetical protein
LLKNRSGCLIQKLHTSAPTGGAIVSRSSRQGNFQMSKPRFFSLTLRTPCKRRRRIDARRIDKLSQAAVYIAAAIRAYAARKPKLGSDFTHEAYNLIQATFSA